MRSGRGWKLAAALLVVSAALACSGGAGSGGGGDAATTGNPSPTPTGGAFHPANYGDPTVHGPDLKKTVTDCRTCHGANLDGGTSGISCDTCHTAGWRTNCVFCHGGTDNQTGAPPRDLDGKTTPNTVLTFSAHTKHVTADSVHVAYDCTQCHIKPTDILSTNHIFDTTHGVAEVVFNAGLNPQGTYLGSEQCSNLWCHGDGITDSGSYDGHFGGTTCDSCHYTTTQYAQLSGGHGLHMNGAATILCSDCHSNVVNSSNTIIAPSLHINRVKDYSMTGITYSGGKCNGTCHDGHGHSNQQW